MKSPGVFPYIRILPHKWFFALTLLIALATPASMYAWSGDNASVTTAETSNTQTASGADLNWDEAFSRNGVDGEVSAMVMSGGNLYIGGWFTRVGNVPALNIACWNGSAWLPLGRGINGPVYALATTGNDLYAGGMFNTAGGSRGYNSIVRWNNGRWSMLGGGVDGHVNAIAISGNNLYAGGTFRNAGGQLVNGIACWNGTWSELGAGVEGVVRALAVQNGNLYAGGSFVRAGGVTASGLARWDGNAWAEVGGGVGGDVRALLVSGNDLYAAGKFNTAGKISALNIARWNGLAWAALGASESASFTGAIDVLSMSADSLYAGGTFTTAGGVPASRIARWNAIAWTPLGSGAGGEVRTLGMSNDMLYAGGVFTEIGGKSASGLGRYSLAPHAVASVSAASFRGPELAPEQIAAAFGKGLAVNAKSSDTLPLPATLAGTTVLVRDSAGLTRQASLFFVSPGQVNYLVPAGTAPGTASVTVTSGDGNVATGTVTIVRTAPALFTADATGAGLPAAYVVRVGADGSQRIEPVFRYEQGKLTPVPMDFGADTDRLFLVMHGTGLRGRGALSAVTVTCGGAFLPVLHAGAVEGFAGLDQVNVELPRDLAGRDLVRLELIVEGKAANPTQLYFK
ncbi:MAG: hypothetical protein ACKV2V_05670 [Blastocatellia bacterium]